MTDVSVQAWLPIHTFVRLRESYPVDFFSCVDQLCTAFPVAASFVAPQFQVVGVTRKSPPQRVAKDLRGVNIHRSATVDFETWVFIDVVCQLDPLSPGSRLTDEVLGPAAASMLPYLIQDVLILAQIAYPGRIKSNVGRAYFDGRPLNEISQVHGVLAEALFESSSTWPEVSTIPLEQVAQWESKLGLLKRGIGRTPLQRALASFTHLCSTTPVNTGELLFWSMQGLEAFYCRGTGDLRRQLSEKSRLFLGEWDDGSNIVGKLYDSRSKFVHGDAPIERWNSDIAFQGDDLDALTELTTAANFSSRLLLSSIQRCILDDIVSLEFPYSIIRK